MVSSEVQRTLVKSPPELWAELSDPASLARHLGELGDIRIVRVEPEKTVEWEARGTTGTVTLKPSGWGTRVTLSVTREPAVTTQPAHTETAAEQPEPVTDEAACDADASLAATVAPEPDTYAPEPEPDTYAPEPDVHALEGPRRGFFARLFARRRKRSLGTATPEPTEASSPPAPIPSRPEPSASAPAAFAAVSAALTPERFACVFEAPQPMAVPVPQLRPGSAAAPRGEPPIDLAAELLAAEEAEVTAVLTAVLDRLGAAHHRPFSRA